MLRVLARPAQRMRNSRRMSQIHFGPSDDALQEIMARNLVSFALLVRHSLSIYIVKIACQSGCRT